MTSIFDDAEDLLPGLLPAAWRGKRFWVVNAEHSVGRRIHQVLFPGIDLKTHDDTGPFDGPIRISGLVIGDDYVQQAEALHAAFRAPGPATLIHPWRGPVRCVLIRPARIEFDVSELRVARIDAEFDPIGTSVSVPNTLGILTGAASALSAAGIALAQLAHTASPVAAITHARATAALSSIIAIAGSQAGQAPRTAAVLPAVATAEAAITGAAALTSRAERAAALASAPALLFSAISASYRPQPGSGIGPGPQAANVPAADPRAGSALLMAIAGDIGRRLRPLDPSLSAGLSPVPPSDRPTGPLERAVLLAAEAGALAEAALLIVQIPFNARQEAQTSASAIDDRLKRAQVSAADLANVLAAPAATLWRALGETRARLAVDLSDTIGRLPAIQRIVPPGDVSAFLLAQHLAGDDPAGVLAFAADIVRRNRLRHPASLGPGPIEVLL